MMKIVILVLAVIFTMAACKSKQPENIVKPMPVTTTRDTVKVKFTASSVANKYDYACGMPVTAGIEDTAHYKGNVYGFCSAECKTAFLENPAGYINKKH